MEEPKDIALSNAPLEMSKSEDVLEETQVGSTSRDYAGAQGKTDPAEIRFVRKIDFRIMVWKFPPSHTGAVFCWISLSVARD